jgi:hypothetical protein
MNANEPLHAETIEPNAAAAQSRGASGPEFHRKLLSGGNFFTVDPVFLDAGTVEPYERKRNDPLYRPLRIYTLDPAASRLEGSVTTVNVPFEELKPGPKGKILEIVDLDETTGTPHAPINLDDPRVLIRNGRDPSLSDPLFHQQMVYAVCTSTYNLFRVALGRDPSWGFRARPDNFPPKLRIRPHAFKQANAYYDPHSGELKFGYFDAAERVEGRNLPCGRVFTALSHDVVAHEMTHAILDGLRMRFRLPTNPDVLAFHEGFADLVAIFLHFSYREVVKAAIERSDGQLESDNLMLSIATQFGHTTGSRGPLRSGIDTAQWGNDGKKQDVKRYDGTTGEPHELGSVLVTAIFDAFATVLRRKIKPYRRLARQDAQTPPSSELAEFIAEQATKLATQFLSICIRGIDYCPPIDLHFGEYLRALITADYDLVPDDPFAYREAFIDAFARRNIYPEDVTNLSEDALLWQGPTRPLEPIAALHFAELRFSGDPGRAVGEAELRRQAEAFGAYVMRPGYAQEFGCALPGDPALRGDKVEPAIVSSIRSLRRIGPDKEVTFELVAEIIQRRWFTSQDGRQSEFLGGSTTVIGPDGKVRYVIRKSITDAKRAELQARHLSSGMGDTYWEEREGRRYLPRTALSALHRLEGGREMTAYAGRLQLGGQRRT